jgi:alkylation response protein AidB-like acyl-CoA dehydrogenase
VNFALDGTDSGFRREVADFLDTYPTVDLVDRCRATGTMHDWELHREMARRGWLRRGWPTEYGGAGGDGKELTDLFVLSDELENRGIPADGLGMVMMVASVIVQAGSETVKQMILPRVVNGEIIICLGYTESHGGSDVASARTSAVRDGDHWVINGHKMFTTLAHEADYVFLLTRTGGPDVPKHRALTMFVVPMDAPGVEVQPVWTIGDVRTNATYYTDVAVPDSYRVGEVDGGWAAMGLALMFERTRGAADARLLAAAVAAARSSLTDDGRPLLDDPSVRERLARVAIEREVAGLLRIRSQWAELQGSASFIEGSMFKLFSAESQVRAAADLIDIFGTEGLVELGEATAPGQGEFAHEFRHSVVTTIYGGSSEVQRRIIAERGLGLPRSSR